MHSELMIFIRYEDNSYRFIHYTQGNVIFYYHKWSLTICDWCFDTLKSSKMQS